MRAQLLFFLPSRYHLPKGSNHKQGDIKMVMPDTVLLPDQHRQAQATYIFFSHHDPAPSMPQQSLQTQPSPPGSDWSLRERRPQPSAMLPACPLGPEAAPGTARGPAIASTHHAQLNSASAEYLCHVWGDGAGFLSNSTERTLGEYTECYHTVRVSRSV